MNRVDKKFIHQVFSQARSHHSWLSEDVPDEKLFALYEILKWGPTSVNSSPARMVFIKSQAGKERIYPALLGSNVNQVKEAPVTVVIGYDTKFYDHLPKLFPAYDARSMFTSDSSLSETTAFRNSTLQGAYLMIAARMLGLDVGPMSGFNNEKLDQILFSGTDFKSNFLCNIGYGDYSKVFPRNKRLEFNEACQII